MKKICSLSLKWQTETDTVAPYKLPVFGSQERLFPWINQFKLLVHFLTSFQYNLCRVIQVTTTG